VCTATAARSFDEASKLLRIIADLGISSRHLQNLCREVGDELVADRDRQTRAFEQRPLNTQPTEASPPIPLGVVMVDGGRMQTRQPGRGPGVHDPAWRETKTAVFLRMTHQAHAVDPRPDLPACFAHPQGRNGAGPLASPPAKPRSVAPEALFRTGLATLADSREFGRQAAAAADRRGLFSARVKAYLGDGLAYNWTIHRWRFADFEPILDFVHAAEHLHHAAEAAGVAGEPWVRACWEGRVGELLEVIASHRERLSPPADPQAEPDHPWCVLNREESYLRANASRMDYPRVAVHGPIRRGSGWPGWVAATGCLPRPGGPGSSTSGSRAR
jgi:hypothetical protein